VAVKTRYALWATAAERGAIARVLDGCPGEPLPSLLLVWNRVTAVPEVRLRSGGDNA
jgi:hypothetical protein